MKAMKGIVIFAFLAVSMIGRVRAQTDVKEQIKEQIVVPLSEPGKPFKVISHVLHGALKVVGYEGKDVVITVTGQTRQKRESTNGGGMTRIGGNAGGDLTAEENHNTVNISSGLSHFALIEIKVPQTGVTLDVGTVNEGNIEIENVTGQLEVSNVNGSISLANVGGSVVANTVNGNVIVTFKSVDPQAPMAFTTLNGRIDVTFPPTLKANLKLKSEKGDIFSDFDIDVTKQQPAVTKTNEDHTYKINFDEWVYGKISGGGPEMMMKTTFGTIFIRKAK